jgi:hypothetical protein
MAQLIRSVALGFTAFVLLAFSCVDAETERPTYEVGEPGVLVIRNPSRLPMAIGLCDFASYQERLPGRWVPIPFPRPPCVSGTGSEGKHTLFLYELIPPKGSTRIEFPTALLQSTPGVMRVLQGVSVACEFPHEPGEPLMCNGVERITTDPVVVFEPGTTDIVEGT